MTDRPTPARRFMEQTLKLSDYTAMELLIALLTKVDRDDGTPIAAMTMVQYMTAAMPNLWVRPSGCQTVVVRKERPMSWKADQARMTRKRPIRKRITSVSSPAPVASPLYARSARPRLGRIWRGRSSTAARATAMLKIWRSPLSLFGPRPANE